MWKTTFYIHTLTRVYDLYFITNLAYLLRVLIACQPSILVSLPETSQF
jgi:hypothetical protein